MYEQFYGFELNPFTNIPNPDLVFLSPQHQRALSTLQYALVSRAGFCVITGDVGAGKTTLVRHILQTATDNLHVGLVSNSKCDSFEELLKWILLAFDLDYKDKDKVEMYDLFVSFIIEQHRNDQPVTLIIDEAQNLDMDNLEQLRMLSNVNTEKGTVLQTILIGQPELWDLLRDPRMSQFAQRISYEYFLKPLDSTELTENYIRYRLEHSGGSPDLFDDDTFKLIWEVTSGVPRLINLLCDTALVYAYGEEKEKVDLNIVNQVIDDRSESFKRPPVKVAKTTKSADTKAGSTKAKSRAPSLIERAVNRKT